MIGQDCDFAVKYIGNQLPGSTSQGKDPLLEEDDSGIAGSRIPPRRSEAFVTLRVRERVLRLSAQN